MTAVTNGYQIVLLVLFGTASVSILYVSGTTLFLIHIRVRSNGFNDLIAIAKKIQVVDHIANKMNWRITCNCSTERADFLHCFAIRMDD